MDTEFNETNATNRLLVKSGRVEENTLSDEKDDGKMNEELVTESETAKQIRCFYFVKFPLYEDPKLKARIEEAEEVVHKMSRDRLQIIEALNRIEAEHAGVICPLKPLLLEDEKYKKNFDKKKRVQTEPPHMHRTHCVSNAVRERRFGFYSWEEKVNDHRIAVDLDGIRKEKHAVKAKILYLEKAHKAISNKFTSLHERLEVMNCKQGKAYEVLIDLRKQHEEMNAYYYQNCSLLNNVRELARKKDINAFEELSHSEVDKFMREWSNNKGFREDYEKRALISLNNRQLSQDGRIRYPDEKSLIPDIPKATELEASIAKLPDEDSEPPSQHDYVDIQNIHEEDNKKLSELESIAKGGDLEDGESTSVSDELQKNVAEMNDIHVEKLKKMKREEYNAKPKLALQRKKLARKAEVKADLRAKREAEKQLKERQKRDKKKAGADPAEAITEVVEPKRLDVKIETQVILQTKKRQNIMFGNKIRSGRQHRVPKSTLNQKRLTRRCLSAIPTALVVMTLVALE